MKLRLMMAMLAVTAASMMLASATGAGEKKTVEKKKVAKGDLSINDELKDTDNKDKRRTQSFCKTYKFKMGEGKTYQIDMKSKDFDSYLRLEDSDGKEVAFDDDGGGFPDARMVYKAPKGGDYTICATTFGGNSTGKFTLTVKDLQGKEPDAIPKQEFKFPPPPPFKKGSDAKPIVLEADKAQSAEKQDELTNTDAKYNGSKLHKLYTFAMEKGKAYRIDHSSKDFDAYLYLEDPDGNVVDQNDDNGESLDSRIIYAADKTGVYRIIATSLGGNRTGKFTLSVRPASAEDSKAAALRKKVNQLYSASPEAQKETVKEAVQFLQDKGKKLGRTDIQLAMQIAQTLDITKNDKVAAEAMKEFAPLFAQASDPTIAAQSKLLEGIGRRLNLAGSEMDIKGKTIGGKDFDLKNLKGKVVLVDFWATWCGPCVGEIPNIKKAYEKYNKDGFEVIGVSLDFGLDNLKKFVAKEQLPWDSIYDGDAKRGEGIADHYGVLSIPFAVLIGRDGRVLSTRARGEELTRLLDEQLGKK